MIYSLIVLNNKINELKYERSRIEKIVVELKKSNVLNEKNCESRAIKDINEKLKDLIHTVELMEEALFNNKN